MGLKVTKEAYTKMIEEDLSILNKHMPQSLELDHIKIVLTSSIDCYYPSDGNPANSKPADCAIFDVRQQSELLIDFLIKEQKLMLYSCSKKELIDRFMKSINSA